MKRNLKLWVYLTLFLCFLIKAPSAFAQENFWSQNINDVFNYTLNRPFLNEIRAVKYRDISDWAPKVEETDLGLIEKGMAFEFDTTNIGIPVARSKLSAGKADINVWIYVSEYPVDKIEIRESTWFAVLHPNEPINFKKNYWYDDEGFHYFICSTQKKVKERVYLIEKMFKLIAEFTK